VGHAAGQRRRPRAWRCAPSGPHLFREQDGGVAVLLAGLGAQSDEAEQEQRQAGAPDHQLPVVVTLQERVVDVEQLEGERPAHHRSGNTAYLG